MAHGLVFTMGNQGDQELIQAYRLEDGVRAWEAPSGRAYREGQGDGPRSTPTISGDFAYALGANGDLTCVEAKTGKLSWKKNLLADYQSRNQQWGICESVLIDGDKLICTPGGQRALMVALNKKNGKEIWTLPAPANTRTGYASPVPIEVGSVRQYVQFTASGTIGVRADDGKLLWSDGRSANGTANCSSAVYSDGMVFTASGYDTGGAMLKLASKGKETSLTFGYFTKDMKNHHGGMVVLDGHLYGTSDPGILTCIELKSGKTKWQNRSVGKGSITAFEGHLIVRSERGPVALIKASPESYEELGRLNPDTSGRPSWPYPVIADGKLFLRDQDTLMCYDLK